MRPLCSLIMCLFGEHISPGALDAAAAASSANAAETTIARAAISGLATGVLKPLMSSEKHPVHPSTVGSLKFCARCAHELVRLAATFRSYVVDLR